MTLVLHWRYRGIVPPAREPPARHWAPTRRRQAMSRSAKRLAASLATSKAWQRVRDVGGG
jgi:hypothetical protein